MDDRQELEDLRRLHELEVRAGNGTRIDGSPIPYDASERTIPDKIQRQLELAGRAGFEGLTSVAQLPYTVPTALFNAGIWGANKAHELSGGSEDTKAPYLPYITANKTNEMLDSAGMPRPEGAMENIASDVMRARAGAMPLGNPNITRAAQIGAASQGSARELGLSEPWQVAAGLVGGVGGTQIANYAEKTIQPLYASGRQKLIADMLQKSAANPQEAAARLSSTQQYVPNSTPLAGNASGDLGLMGAQNALYSASPVAKSDFGLRSLAQNNAQQNYLNSSMLSPQQIRAAEVARQQATEPLYQAASNTTVNPNYLNPVVNSIDNTISSTTGTSAQTASGGLLEDMKSRIQAGMPETKVIGQNTWPPQPIEMTTVPPFQPLVTTYREMRDKLALGSNNPNALGKTIATSVSPENYKLGQALESMSPEFGKAQSIYRQASVPIEQNQLMQDIAAGIQGAKEDASNAGSSMLSKQKLTSAINAEYPTYSGGKAALEDAVSPSHYAALQNLDEDLARNSMNAAVPANNRYGWANMSSPTLLSHFADTLPVVKDILPYARANELMQTEASKAFQDPQLMAKLLMMKQQQGGLLPATAIQNATYWSGQ